MTPTLQESRITASKLSTQALSHIAGGMKTAQPLKRAVCHFPSKLQTHKPFDQAVPFLDIYPTDMTHV